MSLRNCLIVVWVYVVYVIGTVLFISGYLMKHHVVYQNSSLNVHVGSEILCQNFSSLHRLTEEMNHHLNLSPKQPKKSHLQRFNKAVIIIIDALRYDFVINSKIVHNEDTFYLNKMPLFSELSIKFPRNAILFELIADPPTTTLQRLKGITTGSLPTFIDISRNFDSSEIVEDNLLRQMNRMKKSIVFMGDDTWSSLFPNEFIRSFSYPSFNVKDLDTVDNGILDHIYDELQKNDTDILIAHFLGVDHCGHRYGPKHPEMSRKLSQMNDVIAKIINYLRNDTILLVLGDHGMTNTGDHGGDSTKETSSALFLYSPLNIVFNKDVLSSPAISQIDIVPTLSLLLGLPIPFSNLGSIIPFLFTLNSNQHCFDKTLDALIGSTLAAAENALQIQSYLKAYSLESSDIDSSFIKIAENKLRHTSHLWKNVTNDVNHNVKLISSILKGYEEYTKNVHGMFVKKWVTFDLKYLISGLIILCMALFFNIYFAEQIGKEFIITISATVAFICINLVQFLFFSSFLLYSIVFITCCIFARLVLSFKSYFVQSVTCFFNIQSVVIFLLFISSFSNSFIIYEDRVILFLLQSVVISRYYPVIVGFIKQCVQTNKTKSVKHNQKFKYAELLLLGCLMLCIRLGFLFFKCREEQMNCVNTDFILSLEKMHMPQSYKILRLFLSFASIIIPVVIFLYLSSYKNTKKFHTAIAVIIKYGIFFVCVFTSLRWWLNIVSPEAVERILKGNEILLTRAAFFLGVAMSLVLNLFPILSEEPWTLTSKEIYSESMGTFLFIVSQLLHLLAGDAISLAVTLMSATILLQIVLDGLFSSAHDHQVWIDVLIWSLLSRYWFYASAHQATFSSIQWDAAFLLNHKEIHSYILSGTLVVLNTFSSNLLFGLAFPTLMIWSRPIMCSSTSIRRLHLKYIFCFGVKLASHAIAAFILRRHLMAVKVFSPRLIYEIIGMTVTMIAACFGHIFILTVMSQYHKLIRKNLGHVFSDKNE